MIVRHLALSAATAVTCFVAVLALTTETVYARPCQEECDGIRAEQQAYCNWLATERPDEYEACADYVYSEWYSCSMVAYSCGSSPMCYGNVWCTMQDDGRCIVFGGTGWCW